MIGLGRVPEATAVLVKESGDDIQAVLDMALEFGIQDAELWEAMLHKAQGSIVRLNQLLRYAERYKEPVRLIDAYPEETTLQDLLEPLDDMFEQVAK